MKKSVQKTSDSEEAELKRWMDSELRSAVVESFVSNFESRRRLNRLTTALLLSADGTMSFPEAYKKALLDEKSLLLDLVQRQHDYLSTLRTPKVILDSMAKKVKSAEDVVRRIKSLSAKRLVNELAKFLRKKSKEDIISVATCFVDWCAIYDDLSDPKNRSVMRRLLSQ